MGPSFKVKSVNINTLKVYRASEIPSKFKMVSHDTFKVKDAIFHVL